MRAIIIDSTDEQLAIIAINGDKRIINIGEVGMRRHTSAILVTIDNCLNQAQMLPKELEYIGIVVGPGSFTGIRIGVATANAMASATGAKIIELTSLEVSAYGLESCLVLLDCKHDNYYALERRSNINNYIPMSKDDLLSLDLPIIYKKGINSGKLIACFMDKVAKREFSPKGKPFYMKKSSAELQ